MAAIGRPEAAGLVTFFLPDAAHAVVFAATLLVAALLLGLGALAGARQPVLALVAGWGIADLVLLVAGTLFGARLTGTLAALGLCGAAGLVAIARGGFGQDGCRPAGRVLLLAVPFLVIAATVSPAGFDEYSHWLPNLGYLVLHDHLPTLAEPNAVSVRPGYPPGLTFVGLAVSRLVGHMAESAGIVWDALLAVALGATCAELIGRHWRAAPWAAAAVGLAAATLLSPCFEPRLMLSNYGDPPAGYVTAIMAVGLMRWLDDATGDGGGRWRTPWMLGFAGVALVNIRQDSLTVYALVALAALLAVLVERRRGAMMPLLALLPAPLLAAAVWRWYQGSEIPGGAAAMLPLAQWHWPQFPETLASMVQVMLHHWAQFGLLLVLAGVAVAALAAPHRFSALQRAAATLGAVIGLGKTASLALLYLGADFSTAQAATATEFWRFSLHAGPTVAVAALLLLPFARLRAARPSAVAPWLVAALPLLYVGHLRVDLSHGQPAPALQMRAIARDIAALTGGASPITLVDITDADYMNIPHVVEVRYELLLGLRPDLAVKVPRIRLVEGDPPREVVLDGGLLVFAPPDSLADALHAPFVWFYDGGATASRLAGVELSGGASYLVARDAGGGRIVRSWPLPARR